MKIDTKCDCWKEATNEVTVDWYQEQMCNDCFDEIQNNGCLCSSCWGIDSNWFEPRVWDFICWYCND